MEHVNFFVPRFEDPTEAKELYDAIVTFAKETSFSDITDRKIYSLTHRDREGESIGPGEPKTVTATVGKPYALNGEVVYAILEATTFLVCTPSRGVARDNPFMVGKHEVERIIDFAAPTPDI